MFLAEAARSWFAITSMISNLQATAKRSILLCNKTGEIYRWIISLLLLDLSTRFETTLRDLDWLRALCRCEKYTKTEITAAVIGDSNHEQCRRYLCGVIILYQATVPIYIVYWLKKQKEWFGWRALCGIRVWKIGQAWRRFRRCHEFFLETQIMNFNVIKN